jgi:hypothetical protein
MRVFRVKRFIERWNAAVESGKNPTLDNIITQGNKFKNDGDQLNL